VIYLIILLLFTGAYILPFAMMLYYTPVKPGYHVPLAQYLRWRLDVEAGEPYRERYNNILFFNIFITLIALLFFGWLGYSEPAREIKPDPPAFEWMDY
jgi:hypothetical protein